MMRCYKYLFQCNNFNFINLTHTLYIKKIHYSFTLSILELQSQICFFSYPNTGIHKTPMLFTRAPNIAASVCKIKIYTYICSYHMHLQSKHTDPLMANIHGIYRRYMSSSRIYAPINIYTLFRVYVYIVNVSLFASKRLRRHDQVGIHINVCSIYVYINVCASFGKPQAAPSCWADILVYAKLTARLPRMWFLYTI